MNVVLGLFVPLLLGAALGVAYCLALWWATARLIDGRYPAARALAGGLLRIGLVALALYLIGGTHWPSLAAALVGFALARVVVVNAVVRSAQRAGPTQVLERP